MTVSPAFAEHHVDRGAGRIYVRDHAGAAPAFVLMHGFPDNLQIWDDLVPYLAAGGRRVVTFDFLGFGASDKPGTGYSFAQQLGDLEAVVAHLGLGAILPVAHDSSGIAAVNFALAHPAGTASLCILNSAYDDSPLNVWPEMITLFADPKLRALALAIAQSPAQLEWLLTWQKQKFEDALLDAQKPRFEQFLGPLIADNFIRQPSSGTAFVTMAMQFFDELARNTARLPQVAALDLPVRVIWGELDPYLNIEMGRERAGRFRNSSLTPIAAGHWLQIDAPEAVAKAMLA